MWTFRIMKSWSARMGERTSCLSRDGNGDVPPLRTIRGAKTGLDEVRGVAVDPVHNLVVVGSRSDNKGTTGVFIFNRTDNGDVAPRAVIAGPRSGILRIRQARGRSRTEQDFRGGEE